MKHDFCNFLIFKCYKVTQKEVIPIGGMLFNRSGAASVSINGYLWITGGRVMDVLLKTSEFVSLHSAIPGPDLPMPMYKHTMINIENYLTLLIGGQLDFGKSSTRTYYFNHTANEWSSGPKLNHGRFQVLRKMKLAQILALSVLHSKKSTILLAKKTLFEVNHLLILQRFSSILNLSDYTST